MGGPVPGLSSATGEGGRAGGELGVGGGLGDRERDAALLCGLPRRVNVAESKANSDLAFEVPTVPLCVIADWRDSGLLVAPPRTPELVGCAAAGFGTGSGARPRTTTTSGSLSSASSRLSSS